MKFKWLFLLGWLLLNLLQAFFTELLHDEAYYWLYAQELRIGYFDHPPAVAVMIRLGSALFGGEIGLRLLGTLLSTCAIFFLHQATRPKDDKFFFLLIFSFSLMHAVGFISAPDTPLFFFTALFFWLYRLYLKKDSLQLMLLLSVVVAGMLYSKYHGLMMLFFLLLGNLKLLQRKSFWGIVLLANILYFPHLSYLIEHDFASLTYHLGDRAKGAYKINQTLDYLAGELLSAGFLSGIIVLISAFRFRVKELTEEQDFFRSIKYCMIGIFVFLFLLSFHGRVESNWAATAFSPVIILSYHFLHQQPKWQKIFRYLAIPSILLVLVLRLQLIVNIFPAIHQKRSEFHGWDQWAQQIQERANGRKVAFLNSYQYASKYAFYAGEASHSFNSYSYRPNQFDLWDTEEALQGEEVMILGGIPLVGWDTLRAENGTQRYYQFYENLHTYNRVQIEVLQENLRLQADDTVSLPIRISNPYPYDLSFQEDPTEQVRLSTVFLDGKQMIDIYFDDRPIPPIKAGESIELDFRFPTPSEKGNFEILVLIANGWVHFGKHSDFMEVEVE